MRRFRDLILKFNGCRFFAICIFNVLNGFLGFIYRFKYFFTCKLSFSLRVVGWRNLSLGNNIVICHSTWININDRKSGIVKMSIGDNSFIGNNNFFTVGDGIYIGPYCLTASNCSFIGSSHNVNDIYKPYISTGTTNENIITIGANCFFGYDSSIIGNVSIGHGSIVGARTTVTSNIPPFSIVIGNPGKIIRRYDFDKNDWVSDFDNINESKIPLEQDYLESLNINSPYVLLPSILCSKYLSSIY